MSLLNRRRKTQAGEDGKPLPRAELVRRLKRIGASQPLAVFRPEDRTDALLWKRWQSAERGSIPERQFITEVLFEKAADDAKLTIEIERELLRIGINPDSMIPQAIEPARWETFVGGSVRAQEMLAAVESADGSEVEPEAADDTAEQDPGTDDFGLEPPVAEGCELTV